MSPPPDPEAPAHPPAELDRRFYAFTLDRLVAWSLYAVAGYLAWRFLLDRGRVWAGIAVISAAVGLVSAPFALLLGLRGTSPGKSAFGLRAVHADAGGVIGAPAALLRGLVLGAATLPTLGLGAATLAWTAVMDRTGRRRGWHDFLCRSVVVDVRPPPPAEEVEERPPRQVVNLTAMRLLPVPPPPPGETPAAASVRGATAEPPVSDPLPQAGPRTPPPAPERPPPPTTPPPTSPPPTSPPAPAAPDLPARRRRLGPPLGDASAAGPSHLSPPQRWQVSFDTGESLVVEGLTLVGRRPEGRPGEPVRSLVALRSDDMSLSKTHAQFQVVPDGALVVMDRGSTNGTILVRHGVSKALGPGRPATLLDGDVVRFGDRRMTVARSVR